MSYIFCEDLVTRDSITYSRHHDPTGLLVDGQEYEVREVTVHVWYTDVFLTDFPGKRFNSDWFESA